MTHEELERRRPVWTAMSDLFLDTETRWSVPYVARECAKSGYDDETLERIFWGEVFPEGIPNLLDIAGEWGMLTLSEEALIKRVNHPSIPWLTRRAHGWMVEHTWLAAREVTTWMRGVDDAQRSEQWRVLNALGRRFFEEPHRPLADVWEKDVLGSHLELARAEWRRYEAVCRKMAHHESDVPDAAAGAVRKLLGLE